MKSPFVNFSTPETETYPEANELYEGINFKSPFVDGREREGLADEALQWEDEDMVDEEEMEFDLHESEDGEFTNDGESDEAEIEMLGEELYEGENSLVVDPLPVPEKNPIPFAEVPTRASYWPIITTHKKGREVAFLRIDKKYIGNVGRRFLALRTDGRRCHVGVDLWANDKDPIVACEDGKIVNFYHFYRSTYALLVEHEHCVINYGEVHKDSLSAYHLKIGDAVKAGQVIGIVGKMYSSSMLHFETYVKGTRSNKRFMVGTRPPKELLNPTKYLLFLQQQGLKGNAVVKASRDADAVRDLPKAIPAPPLSLPRSSDSVVSQILQHTSVIEQYSSVFKINSNLVRGIIAAESGGNPLVGKGGGGYKGLMQAERTPDQLQPAVSVKTGIAKFIQFRDKTLNPWLDKLRISRPAETNENYLKACLSCYNAGPVTALKAIQYAHAAGDWQQWLEPENYLRALVFSGGYAQYDACSKGAKSADVTSAKAERIKYRFKTSGWRSEPDPAPWSKLVSVINPIMRCWIETKHRNTPGYLDKFIRYFKYFQNNPGARELEYLPDYEDQDQFSYDGELDDHEFEEHDRMDEYEGVGDDQLSNEEELLAQAELEVEENLNGLNQEGEEEDYEAYDELEGFEPEEELSYEDVTYEEEEPIDQEEWEEDRLETTRGEASTYPETEDEWEHGGFNESESPDTKPSLVSPGTYTKWYNTEVGLIKRFPNEPSHNIDQLPIPPWINHDSFYNDFIEKYGNDARTIIGDASKKVLAKYFVLHDTAVAADFKQSHIKGKGIHLWVNAQSPVLLGNDWHVKGLGVKLERRKNNSFVHTEITRDKELQKSVQQKTKGKKPSYEEIIQQGGLKNVGTYYTDKQYDLVAYAYLVASIRRGKFLTITIHREVDRSVVVRRQNGQYGYGHDDPQFFDLDYFYGIVGRILAIPVKATFGIESKRAYAHKQGNMAGYNNAFIPFVAGDAEAANQYGELVHLNPKAAKYKIVKLKYGYYYDVTRLTNKLQQAEMNEELSFELPRTFSSLEVGTPQSVAISTPSLIAEDSSLPGYTCYVRIDLGKGNYPLNMTGIYVPAVFDPRQPVDVVLYMHGMTGTFPGACAQIIDYWNVTSLPTYDLRIREEINASGKNVILVAPSFGDYPNKYHNTLSAKGHGLDKYLVKVLAAVNSHIVKKRFNSSSISFRNIILAAHSAGGMQMLKTVTAENPIYGPKVLECWGFDSLYGREAVVDLWYNWAKKNSAKRLMLYYQGSTANSSTLLERKSKGLSNVFVKRSSAKNHYWVPKEHLRDRVTKIGQTNLTKMNFEESSMPEQYFTSGMDDLVKDSSNAVSLNRHYGEQLGWNQFIDQINDLLLPFSGQQNVRLGEEAFAQALANWQQRQGFSAHDSDGIMGPQTWIKMKPLLTSSTMPAVSDSPLTGTGPIEQTEWDANPRIHSQYRNWQAYKTKRDDVVRWGISSPANYIEAAIDEWNANKSIHDHFGNNFDGDPKHSYLNLKRLYQKKNITDPAAYFAANLVSIVFFNRKTPGHRNLGIALSRAQSALLAAGHNFSLLKAWSFVPRTVNFDINTLSNHALGTAIDINSDHNPHIRSREEILVIDTVCRAVLPSGLLAESDPDVLKRASDHFRNTYNDAWIGQQTQASVLSAIRNNRSRLTQFANNGFLNLSSILVRALIAAGLRWGGAWPRSKDFMHFELP